MCYGPEACLVDGDVREHVDHWLDELSDKQREVVVRRFGLRGHESATLEEVGAEIGLTRERVRQIRSRSTKETAPLIGKTGPFP